MFNLVIQTVEKQEKSSSLTVEVIKVHYVSNYFLKIADYDKTDWYQVPEAWGSEVN